MSSLLGLELDDGNVLLKFVETTAETDGALHAQEARYVPHSKPPPYHTHPIQDERFQIIEGGLEFLLDGAERIVRAGDELAIPRGTPHRAHNPFDAPAIVRWETRPALRTGEMFRLLYTANKRGKVPLSEAAAILREYSTEMQLSKPHPLVQRIVFGCLAPFGRKALRR